MRLFLNGLAASTSSGLTYLRNVLPLLSQHPGVQVTAAVGPAARVEFANLPHVALIPLEGHSRQGPVKRFWFEQKKLPAIIRASGADVLVSAGNFAIRKSSIPQVLLSGNSLYTSKDFIRDLRRRRECALLADTYVKAFIARRSVLWSDCTIAPSAAFAQELHEWTGTEVLCIHHGFDPDVFFGGDDPLPQEMQNALDASANSFRLLFVTHYNYYRNFETLFRSLPLICKQLGSRDIRLFLTCRLKKDENPGRFRTKPAAELVRALGIKDLIVELGAVPYRVLHKLYKSCNLYVTPAYTETFAHPLVEAMACGLPVVASDLPVHREVCRGAALYFPRFSPEELAERVVQIIQSPTRAHDLAARALSVSREFSWQKHVEELIAVAERLCEKRRTAVTP